MKCIPVITAGGGGGGGGVGIQDGTIVIGTPINNGVSYFFDATKDPKSDPRLDLHEALEKPPQLLTEGSTKFVRFTSHVGGLHSNGTQLTCRVHIKTMSSGNVQCYWDTCTPSKGFMVGDKDLGDGEVTAIVRPNGIVDHGEAVTMKRRGGNHSNGHFASCIGFIFNYNCNAKMFEKEFDHPHYEFYNINIIKPYPSYEDKWVGLKALSLVLPDKTCRNVGYVNPDPLDSNGKPKNDGWFKVFEYIDKGKGKKYAPVCTWGGSLETVRCDQAKTMDIAYLNYVAISAIP